jgi:hypothetical protein
LLWRCDPTRIMASSFFRFLDHTQRHTTVGRTSLDKWPARRRDLYLTTHNTHNRQTSMPPEGFETHNLRRRAAAELSVEIGNEKEFWQMYTKTLLCQILYAKFCVITVRDIAFICKLLWVINRKFYILTLILLTWRIGWAPNSIPKNIQQDTLHSLYLETALHVSGGIPPIIKSVYNCIYSIWYLSHRYCYLPLSWKSWNRFECALGGLCHAQHTQTGSNSSTIEADSSNGVSNTWCCRYICMRSWWWMKLPPEICRAVSRYK